MSIELLGVDFNKPTFEMVGGMSIDDIRIKYNWFLNAEVENAIIGEDDNGLVWYSGDWICGTWESGTWYSGTFHNGRWKDGDFYSYEINQRDMMLGKLTIERIDINQSQFLYGSWEGGTFHYGLFGKVNTEVEIPTIVDLDFILENSIDYYNYNDEYYQLLSTMRSNETFGGLKALCLLNNTTKYLTTFLENNGADITIITKDDFMLLDNKSILFDYDLVLYDYYVWSVPSDLISKGKDLADIGMVVISSGNDTGTNVFVTSKEYNTSGTVRNAITVDNKEHILGVSGGENIGTSSDSCNNILSVQPYCQVLYTNIVENIEKSILGYLYEVPNGGSFYHDQLGLSSNPSSSDVYLSIMLYQINRSFGHSYIQSPSFDGGDFDNGWMNITKINGGNTNNGYYNNSIRYDGSQYNGIFLGDIWYNGQLLGGDFSNGVWYDGLLSSFVDTIVARFGTDYKDDGAVWKDGKFVNGEFHSKLNLDTSGLPIISLDHSKVRWEDGEFNSGKWYGGQFEKGLWNGGTFYMGIIGKLSAIETEMNYDRVDDGNDSDFNVQWYNGHIYDCLWYTGVVFGGTISGGMFHYIKANNTNFGYDI